MDATLGPPRAERPYEGQLQITTDIMPMAGVEYDAGGVAGATESREREALFDRLVERAVRHTEAIDREALCVIAGKVVWHIHLTVHLLADHGAPVDAAVLASMVALRHFRRSDVSVADGEVTVYSSDERVPVPLAYHHMPFCMSFAMFILRPETETERSLLMAQSHTASTDSQLVDMDVEKEGPKDLDIPVALLDPSMLEQTLAHSSISIVMNAQREVCVLDKAGGVSLPYQVIMVLLKDAAMRAKELTQLVETALAEDASKRVTSVP